MPKKHLSVRIRTLRKSQEAMPLLRLLLYGYLYRNIGLLCIHAAPTGGGLYKYVGEHTLLFARHPVN